MEALRIGIPPWTSSIEPSKKWFGELQSGGADRFFFDERLKQCCFVICTLFRSHRQDHHISQEPSEKAPCPRMRLGDVSWICGYVPFFWWSHKQIDDHRLPGCPLSATYQNPYVLQNHRFCVHRALQRPSFYIGRLESSIQSPFQSWTLPILDRNKTITSLNSHLTSPHSHIL